MIGMQTDCAAPAQCLETVQENNSDCNLEARLQAARDHQEEIRLLMEYTRQALKEKKRLSENT